MSTRIPIIQVDAFTAEPFGGNPAAVCLLEDEASESWMQAVAAEMNLSETAFVRRLENGEFSIRWFTPTVEVPLCGHATLASAHALWEDGGVSAEEPITFHAQEGVLKAKREADWICLDFPAMPVETWEPPAAFVESLQAQPVSTFRNRLGVSLVVLDSEATVRTLRPDFAGLATEESDACIVTARAESDAVDFVSRFFAPGFGIDEDPVTGSAHCSLGPYWGERLGKTELVAHQVSKRGGVVRVRWRGDRVDLLGQAVTVIRGVLVG